jgi:hypothetical protein
MLKGKISPVQALRGRLGGLTDAELAEINAELDKLLSETDPEWTAKLAAMGIAAKIRFLQLCRGDILNSIENKGVTIPDAPPFRTIAGLIEQIGTGGGEQEPAVPDVPEQEPVAYLYGSEGVRLPPLPEYNQTLYPHLFMVHSGFGEYRLFAVSEPVKFVYADYGGTYNLEKQVGFVAWSADTDSVEWKRYYTASIPDYITNTGINRVIWTDFPIYFTDGSLHFDKSADPVPVYE